MSVAVAVDWVECPDCGERYLPAAVECPVCSARESDGDEATLDQKLLAAGVPAVLSPWATRLAWVQKFGAWPLGPDLGRLLLVWGPEGTGKSSLAAVLVAEWLERGNPAAWVPVRELHQVEELAIAADRARSPVAPEIIDRRLELGWTRPSCHGLVVLDDVLASGAVSPRKVEELARLVDWRLSRALPTIVTTNMPVSELKSAHPASGIRSLGSRLLSGIVIYLRGSDRRLER